MLQWASTVAIVRFINLTSQGEVHSLVSNLADRLFWLPQVTAEFNHINGLSLVCRAHQLVQEGLKYMFQGALAFPPPGL